MSQAPKYFGHDLVEFEESSNTAGWIVSYADMMTIILTFMILLLSISTIAQTKFDLLVSALTGEQVGNLQEVKIKIDEVIEKESLGGEVKTRIDENGLTIQFSNALLFLSGSATLTERASTVFEPIAHHLVNDLEPEYGLVIEGYTDDRPIATDEFKSNWELSTSRAIDVMHRLEELGLNQARMSVQGFADTRKATDIDLHDMDAIAKLSDDELAALRASNRRVILRIDRLDKSALEALFGMDMKAATELKPVEKLQEKQTNHDLPDLPSFGNTARQEESE